MSDIIKRIVPSEGLRDYLVNRDHFKHGSDCSIYGFPCCCCEHHLCEATVGPCQTCDHNVNAVKEAANAAGEARPASPPTCGSPLPDLAPSVCPRCGADTTFRHVTCFECGELLVNFKSNKANAPRQF